ncbi:wax ester/triacylglycerol synthase domain-containing protein [Pendulispora albinea]|uniref:diacylglycerol O-acyltransferase n=1 Tax=Pendulispora albinea TaxID=2741071 RepID=A0ABZ2M6F8_9BACT
MERLRGFDAAFLHMERGDVQMHTLKVLVVDPARLGRPLALEDVHRAIEGHLDAYPRARQIVVAAPLFGGRPFWVSDPRFTLAAHLTERTVAAPGGQAELDAVLSELASQPLDRSRPLWDLTLVHGLAHGRQGLVVRLHHAISDGVGAINAFAAMTREEPGAVVAPSAEGSIGAAPSRAELFARAARDVGPWLGELPRFFKDVSESNRKNQVYRAEAKHLPPVGFGAGPSFTTKPVGAARRCATGNLALADFERVKNAFGVTMTAAVQAVLAGALRREQLRRGEEAKGPLITTFGVAIDRASARLWGNEVTATFAHLAVHMGDPVERLRATAASTQEAIALVRHLGTDMAGRWSEYLPRLPHVIGRRMAYKTKNTLYHVGTASVRGPSRTRWLGPVEVVEWYSLAALAHPPALHICAYSYVDRMSIGILTAPEIYDRPRRLLEDMEDSLAELVSLAHRTDEAPGDVSTAAG